MRINKQFALKYIKGIPYLLPYGQNVADQLRGVKINETGVFLWNAMGQVDTAEELLELFMEHYEADETQRERFAGDLRQFLLHLQGLKIVDMEEEYLEKRIGMERFSLSLNVGNVSILLQAPETVIDTSLYDFQTDGKEPDENVDLRIEVSLFGAPFHEGGRILLYNEELCVSEWDDFYGIICPNSDRICEAFLRKDGTVARIYLRDNDDLVREQLFHLIRLFYLYVAQKKGVFAVHSASVLYKEKVWVFAGHSGRGKSTHTKMWSELEHTPIINGDLNLLQTTEQGVFVHGLPWCGTSGIYNTKTYPLGGIVLVERGETDVCEELEPDKKELYIMQHMISPMWTEEQLSMNLEGTERLAKSAPVCRLRCTKTPHAVAVMKEWIDRNRVDR